MKEAGSKVTAFVSHSDCARHDTGWGHPDHQGRLPALTRAVHADMLTLFEPLLEVEGRHATAAELEMAHAPAYLDRVRRWSEEAALADRLVEVAPGLVASAATWDASVASVGCALAGVEAIVAGDVRNAFCVARPPARDARHDSPGVFGFLNPIVAVVRSMSRHGIAADPIVVEWGATPSVRTTADSGVRVASFAHLRSGTGGPHLLAELRAALDLAGDPRPPDFVILSAGFDWVAGDPVAGRSLSPRDYYDATEVVRERADGWCDGRLLSVLDGGYESRGLGECVVQHLRALAGLEAA